MAASQRLSVLVDWHSSRSQLQVCVKLLRGISREAILQLGDGIGLLVILFFLEKDANTLKC